MYEVVIPYNKKSYQKAMESIFSFDPIPGLRYGIYAVLLSLILLSQFSYIPSFVSGLIFWSLGCYVVFILSISFFKKFPNACF